MRRLLLFSAVLTVTSVVWAAKPVFITPDVPTDESLGGTTILPDEVLKYTGVSFLLQGLGVLPANTHLDGIHKLDKLGDWLFSVESATDFPTFTAEARDVVRYTSSTGTYSLFFCGASVVDPVPAGSNVDAVYLDGHDGSDLIVSFDVHSTIPAAGMTFEPADLVRYTPTGGWPGNLSSQIDGLSCLSNPGRVPTTIMVKKSATPGNIEITWSASCADAEDYAIYEGVLPSFYSHTLKLCTDTGGDFVEDFTPTAPSGTSRYYLVVPQNPKEGEGSYGLGSAPAERPVGSAVCVATQLLTPCPP